MATIGLVPGRPSGLGTSAAALAAAGRPARATQALYCPPAVRDDPQLAALVQTRLQEWAAAVGLAPEPVAGLGRLAVLTHPDTNDAARLSAAARLLAIGRLLAGATLGGATLGGSDTELPRRSPGAGGTQPAQPTEHAAPQPSTMAAAPGQGLDDRIDEVYNGCDVPDGALRPPPEPARAAAATMPNPALLSALAGLSALPASPYQVERVRRECQALGALTPGGGPRPPWEYLSLGHVNAYSPALAALDAVDGYELSAGAAADPELRRAQRLAALAAGLLHDIAFPAPAGLTAAIAHSDGLGPGAAGRRAAQIHDEAMRAFQYHAAHLAASADKPTRRYLAGLWTWLGGHRSWHAVT